MEQQVVTNGTDSGWQDAASASLDASTNAHKPRRFQEWLWVDLTEQELAETARAIGDATKQVRDAEAKKAEVVDHWKGKIAGLESKKDELCTKAETGKEERETWCVETWDYRTGVITAVREDTGEIIRQRAMTSAERQGDLFASPENDAHRGYYTIPPSENDISDPQGVLGDEDDGGDVAPKKRGRRVKGVLSHGRATANAKHA